MSSTVGIVGATLLVARDAAAAVRVPRPVPALRVAAALVGVPRLAAARLRVGLEVFRAAPAVFFAVPRVAFLGAAIVFLLCRWSEY